MAKPENQGNRCRKLMSCGVDIIKSMKELLKSMNTGQKNFSDKDTGELFGCTPGF